MAIDATVSGSAANSYVTIAETTEYFTNERIGGSAWIDAGSQQEPSLRQAAIAIDSFNYPGENYEADQALKFPMRVDGDFYGYGYGISSGRIWEQNSDGTIIIPIYVKHAQMECALWIIENQGDDVWGGAAELSDSLSLGDMSIKPRHNIRYETVGKKAADLINRYTDSTGTIL